MLRKKKPRALVTSGPTHEALDPVRFISNHSSGKQGHAIAAALAAAGFDVTLVSGPVNIPAPPGVELINVTSAREMHEACMKALPVEVAVCAAAVSDWRPTEISVRKLKKVGGAPPVVIFTENPDILREISNHPKRPKLVVGFAAETDNVIANARAKLAIKGCDMILANDVANGNVFNADNNTVTVVTRTGEEAWPKMSKKEIAARLAKKIGEQIL